LNSGWHELYRQVLVDHSRSPRNFRAMGEASRKVEGYNRLCGDQITMYVRLDDDRIADISFQGSGCAISTASASLLTEAVKGKTRAEARTLFEGFRDLVTTRAPRAPLGKLTAFSGVADYPVRVKCATLAWHALRSALEGKEGTVSTE